MSTPVKTASRTMLPDGRLSFIVFRRDLTTNAPDHVAVRIIAKVIRGMTFDSVDKASITNLDDQWAIRGTSYDLRVAPLPQAFSALDYVMIKNRAVTRNVRSRRCYRVSPHRTALNGSGSHSAPWIYWLQKLAVSIPRQSRGL
jgi:hypothetical protein